MPGRPFTVLGPRSRTVSRSAALRRLISAPRETSSISMSPTSFSAMIMKNRELGRRTYTTAATLLTLFGSIDAHPPGASKAKLSSSLRTTRWPEGGLPTMGPIRSGRRASAATQAPMTKHRKIAMDSPTPQPAPPERARRPARRASLTADSPRTPSANATSSSAAAATPGSTAAAAGANALLCRYTTSSRSSAAR